MNTWIRLRTRHIAWVLLMALALQGLATAVQASSVSAQTAGNSIPLVICTPSGMVVLPASFDLETGAPDVAAPVAQHCIFCAASHMFPALLALGAVLWLPPDRQPAFSEQPDDPALPGTPAWQQLPVRAPPPGAATPSPAFA